MNDGESVKSVGCAADMYGAYSQDDRDGTVMKNLLDGTDGEDGEDSKDGPIDMDGADGAGVANVVNAADAVNAVEASNCTKGTGNERV